jgi:hypothetical protein
MTDAKIDHQTSMLPTGETLSMDCESGGSNDLAIIEAIEATPHLGGGGCSRRSRLAIIGILLAAVIVTVTAIAVPLATKAKDTNHGVDDVTGSVGTTNAAAVTYTYDVVVYGDSSAAVTAAVSAKRQGSSVVLVNPTHFLGGMSASGLGATDFGNCKNQKCIGGIAEEFYTSIANAYGKAFVRNFEPHVGQKVFEQLIADANVTVFFNESLNRESGVEMDGARIVSITTLSNKTFQGKMFIDTSYVGDLMAAAGVSYTVGRESEATYNESLAGVRRGDIQPRSTTILKAQRTISLSMWIPTFFKETTPVDFCPTLLTNFLATVEETTRFRPTTIECA